MVAWIQLGSSREPCKLQKYHLEFEPTHEQRLAARDFMNEQPLTIPDVVELLGR